VIDLLSPHSSFFTLGYRMRSQLLQAKLRKLIEDSKDRTHRIKSITRNVLLQLIFLLETKYYLFYLSIFSFQGNTKIYKTRF